MTSHTVCLDWIRDQSFLMRDRNGFPIVMDQPSGANAADLLPLSLIGCTVYDVVAILRKQRQQLTALRVSATSVQDDEPPWRFRSIRIRYTFTGRGLKEALVKRAIELSETRYCAVYATLRDAVEIVSEYEIAPDKDGEAKGEASA